MEELVCGICHDEKIEEIGEIDCCYHRYHYSCIIKWSKIENTCPFCKLRFKSVTRKRLASPAKLARATAGQALPGEVLQVEVISECNQRVVFQDPDFQEWIENVGCMVCGGSEDEDQLLLCDGCDQACHTHCVGLSSIPEGDWYCATCTQRLQRSRHGLSRRPTAAGSPSFNRARERERIARRHRNNQETIDLVDSDEDVEGGEDESVRPPPARQRRLARIGDGPLSRRRGAGAAGTGGRGGRDTASEMTGFIVDDSDEDSDGDGEYAPQEVEGRSVVGRRGSERNQQQRRRVSLASPMSLPSDIEAEWTEDENDDKEEENASDGSLDGVLEASRGSRRPTITARDAARNCGARSTSGANLMQQRRTEQSGPTAAHRRVDAVQRNWGALRAGASSFRDVFQSADDELQQQQQQPRRRKRLRSARELEEDTGAPSDVVDLTSPADANAALRRNRQQDPRGLSPPLLSLSSRIRAELAQCKERGAQLVPRTGTSLKRPLARAPAATPPSHTPRPSSADAPSSSGLRMRTVRDYAFGASVARSTPGSSGPASGGSGGGGGGGGRSGHQGPGGGGRTMNTTGQQLGTPGVPPSLRSFAFQPVRRAPVDADGGSPRPLWERLQHRTAVPRFHAAAPSMVPPPPQQQQRPFGNTAPHAQTPTPEGLRRPPHFTAVVDGHADNAHNNADDGVDEYDDVFKSADFSQPDGEALVDSKNGSGPPSSNPSNPKRKAMELVKTQLKLLFEAGNLTRGQYKEVAKRAVKSLYQKYGSDVTGDHAAVAVDEAVIGVFREGNSVA